MQGRLDRRFHLATSDAPPIQPRRNDSAVVDDKRISGTHDLGKISYIAIVEMRRHGWPHHQEPRGIAWNDRTQRNALGRQLEVEQIGAHSPSYQGAAREVIDAERRADRGAARK
jgi:hypothetical protein